MDKKDIYEHLARIYLEASSQKGKKKTRRIPKVPKNILFFTSVLAIGALIFLFANLYKSNHGLKTEIALVLVNDAVKINFNFDPAKKETYSLQLNNLNLSSYNTLTFSAKNITYRDNKVSLRVEFTNRFNERSEVYLRDIPLRWQAYKINLSEFKNMSDWSAMSNLTFVVEEWNVTGKRGIVYLDNVMLLSQKRGG